MTDPNLFPSLASGTTHRYRRRSAWKFGGCTCGWEAPAKTALVGMDYVDAFEAHMLVVRNPGGNFYHRNMTVEDQRAIALRLNSPTVETQG